MFPFLFLTAPDHWIKIFTGLQCHVHCPFPSELIILIGNILVFIAEKLFLWGTLLFLCCYWICLPLYLPVRLTRAADSLKFLSASVLSLNNYLCLIIKPSKILALHSVKCVILFSFRNFCSHRITSLPLLDYIWTLFPQGKVKGFSFLFYDFFLYGQGNRLGYPAGKKDFEQVSFPPCHVHLPVDPF